MKGRANSQRKKLPDTHIFITSKLWSYNINLVRYNKPRIDWWLYHTFLRVELHLNALGLSPTISIGLMRCGFLIAPKGHFVIHRVDGLLLPSAPLTQTKIYVHGWKGCGFQSRYCILIFFPCPIERRWGKPSGYLKIQLYCHQQPQVSLTNRTFLRAFNHLEARVSNGSLYCSSHQCAY